MASPDQVPVEIAELFEKFKNYQTCARDCPEKKLATKITKKQENNIQQ